MNQKIQFLLLILFSTTSVIAQNSFRAVLMDNETKEPLLGATAILKGTSNGSSSNIDGTIEIQNIPNGIQSITVSFIGYETLELTYTFPIPEHLQDQILYMNTKGEALDEIVIASTRSTRTIENIPTRVEFIAGEELEEKGNMKPGDIRMMLNESTGIQTQQTSATSYNSSIRIQGLDGKYTQILRDGLPLYGGFSGGLSLLQIVPLDLKQVEVIKGASSTLYGGGAIAGLVNLISKTPEDERHLDFLLNGTSALGLDVSGFFSQKFKKMGTTVFASYNLGTPYDPSDIGLTAIPKFNRFTINPRFFYYFNDGTILNVGFNNTVEDRIGGDIKFIEGKGDNIHSYYEKNKTNRFSTQLGVDRILNVNSKLSIKNSISIYDRSIAIPDFKFSGTQLSSFSEINYTYNNDRTEWIGGLNLWTEAFTQDNNETQNVVDYNYTTLGVFVQNTFNISDQTVLETGLRGDYQNEFGVFLLPRVSALFKINPKLSARIGGGMGYKAPTVFTEDAERIQFRNVLPIDPSMTKAEQSLGGNFDINYNTSITEDLFFSVNSLLFYTQVKDPLRLMDNLNGYYEYQQPNGYIDTKGIETNLKFTYRDFKLFVGYTLADVNQHYGGEKTTFPLVAKHRLNNVLMYEIEEELKIGLEAYYYSSQQLNDGSIGKSYWITGLMMEKLWENFSIFLNFENYLDTRQTRFDTIYTGTITNPMFRDIYAPLDGFVINGGLKLNL